ADDAGGVEVALGRGGGGDADGVVGEVEVGGVAVGLAVDGDDLDAQLLAGPDDPQGDLAAVGDQDALEHDGGPVVGGRGEGEEGRKGGGLASSSPFLPSSPSPLLRRSGGGIVAEQHLAVLDGLAVLDDDLDDDAAAV